MKIIQDLTDFEIEGESVITLGKFDGVHRGHRKLICRVCERAKQESRKAVVFTFSVPPQVSMGERAPYMLMTNDERRNFLRRMNVDVLVECPFTEALRIMEPEKFVQEILQDRLHMKGCVTGTDFRFGKDRKGTPAFLKTLGEKKGFYTEILPKELEDGKEISSSRIRQEVQEGDMEETQKLLGYAYSVSGEIVHGRHLGHTLGFPTINQIPPSEKLLPPRGVYFSRTEVAGKVYQGISNIGVKPTVDGSVLGIETYLFDCSLDLYGMEARVELLHFRRREKKFDSLDQLKMQMEKDIASADLYFGESS